MNPLGQIEVTVANGKTMALARKEAEITEEWTAGRPEGLGLIGSLLRLLLRNQVEPRTMAETGGDSCHLFPFTHDNVPYPVQKFEDGGLFFSVLPWRLMGTRLMDAAYWHGSCRVGG